MYENRTKYPKKKTQMYQQLQELPKKYNVLTLIRMEKVRATQLLPLRKKFQGEVEIISIKDKVARIALAKTGIKGIEKFIDKLNGQCLFMFTNMSPFKLNVLLGKNKIMLAMLNFLFSIWSLLSNMLLILVTKPSVLMSGSSINI